MNLSFLSKLAKMIINMLRWCWRYGFVLFLFSAFYIAFAPPATIPVNDPFLSVAFDLSEYSFDFITWEIEALQAKARQALSSEIDSLTDVEQSDFVRQYMADLSRAQQIEAQLARAYQYSPVPDPRQLQRDLDALRADLRERQGAAEAILESQVATILLEEGFGGDRIWPPMAMRFTQIPDLLVTSPRDEIRLEISLPLQQIPVAERSRIEAKLEAEYEFSALIVPLGGIALYPAMIYETTSIPYAVETFAHEWLHHYLYFFPLGLSYFTGDAFAGDARIINETTADWFGKEIGGLVLERYYPEYVAPELPTYDEAPIEFAPDVFDFAAEISETRIRLDELLAAGDIASAEAYLEERRVLFNENDYFLRKLNQAYFAFYGGYQVGSGAGGADPIGQAIIAIRAASDSIHDFVLNMRPITNQEELLELQTKLTEP